MQRSLNYGISGRQLEAAIVQARSVRAIHHRPLSARRASGPQVLEGGATTASMPTSLHPPRQLLSEIGRRSVPISGTHAGLDNGTGSDHKLAPFACGITGTPAEVPDPRPCSIEGSFPTWLSGNLYRNGPGTFDVKTKQGKVFSLAHWFNGLTVMHKFQIQHGQVTYRNKHLNRETEHFMQSENRYPGIMIWNEPCGTLMGRAFSSLYQFARDRGPGFEFTDPETGIPGKANVGVTVGNFRGDKLVSRTDANVLLEVDPEDMHVTKQFDYAAAFPEAKGPISAAHPERDEARGLTYNYAMNFGARGQGIYTLFCIPDDESQEPYTLAQVQHDPCYAHSFASTENYIILMLWPCHYSPLKMLLNRALYSEMQWKGENSVKFFVVDKKQGGQGHVASYQHDTFFCFHTINAFEDGDDIVIDLAAYKDHSILAQLHRSNLLFGLSPMDDAIATRFTLPKLSEVIASKATAAASSRSLMTQPTGFELFTIHPSFKCKPYRYSYGVSMQEGDGFWSEIVKLDVETGATRVWREEGTFPGEPIFVAGPAGSAEDDGVLLSVVLAGVQERSFLLVLDAHSMLEIGRAWTVHPVSLGFHGHFSHLASVKQNTAMHSAL